MIEKIVFYTTIIVIIGVLWLKTDSFIEYCKLFRINKLKIFRWLYINEYIKILEQNIIDQNYPEFLESKYNAWIFKVGSCFLCFGFWLSLMAGIIVGLETFPVIYLSSLILFFLVSYLMKNS